MADALFQIPDALCVPIPGLNVCSVLMPGGLDIEAPNLLTLMQPALTPLAPAFSLMEVVVALKNCLEAVPDAIVELDPSALLECFPALAEKLGAVLKMLPQVSVPLMVVDLLGCIIAELERFRAVVVGLQLQLQRIAAVAERAAQLGDADLSLIAACGSDRVAAQLSDEMKGLIVVGRLLGMVTLFLSMAGVDVAVPDLSSLAGVPLALVIEPLDALIGALRGVRDSIPV